MAEKSKVTKADLIVENVILTETKKDLEDNIKNLCDEVEQALTDLESSANRERAANIGMAEKDTQISNLEAELAQLRLYVSNIEAENSSFSDQITKVVSQAEFMVNGLGAIITYRGPNLTIPRNIATALLEGVTSIGREDDDVRG